jgi:hypothetical protein
MPDLHAWITAQIDRVEAIASGHTQWSPDWYYDASADEVRDRGNRGTVAFAPTTGTGRHIAANDPAAVLRRCAADRRILARHSTDPDDADAQNAPTCRACNYTNKIGMMSIRLAVDLADCPELLDLAHAHGITDQILASLDRPQRPEIKPWEYRPCTHVADVSAALRRINWKGRS